MLPSRRWRRVGQGIIPMRRAGAVARRYVSETESADLVLTAGARPNRQCAWLMVVHVSQADSVTPGRLQPVTAGQLPPPPAAVSLPPAHATARPPAMRRLNRLLYTNAALSGPMPALALHGRGRGGAQHTGVRRTAPSGERALHSPILVAASTAERMSMRHSMLQQQKAVEHIPGAPFCSETAQQALRRSMPALPFCLGRSRHSLRQVQAGTDVLMRQVQAGWPPGSLLSNPPSATCLIHCKPPRTHKSRKLCRTW